MTAVSYDPADYPAHVHLMVSGVARLKYGGDEQAAWEAYWHDLGASAPLLVKPRSSAEQKTARRPRRKNG